MLTLKQEITTQPQQKEVVYTTFNALSKTNKKNKTPNILLLMSIFHQEKTTNHPHTAIADYFSAILKAALDDGNKVGLLPADRIFYRNCEVNNPLLFQRKENAQKIREEYQNVRKSHPLTLGLAFFSQHEKNFVAALDQQLQRIYKNKIQHIENTTLLNKFVIFIKIISECLQRHEISDRGKIKKYNSLLAKLHIPLDTTNFTTIDKLIKNQVDFHIKSWWEKNKARLIALSEQFPWPAENEIEQLNFFIDSLDENLATHQAVMQEYRQVYYYHPFNDGLSFFANNEASLILELDGELRNIYQKKIHSLQQTLMHNKFVKFAKIIIEYLKNNKNLDAAIIKKYHALLIELHIPLDIDNFSTVDVLIQKSIDLHIQEWWRHNKERLIKSSGFYVMPLALENEREQLNVFLSSLDEHSATIEENFVVEADRIREEWWNIVEPAILSMTLTPSQQQEIKKMSYFSLTTNKKIKLINSMSSRVIIYTWETWLNRDITAKPITDVQAQPEFQDALKKASTKYIKRNLKATDPTLNTILETTSSQYLREEAMEIAARISAPTEKISYDIFAYPGDLALFDVIFKHYHVSCQCEEIKFIPLSATHSEKNYATTEPLKEIDIEQKLQLTIYSSEFHTDLLTDLIKTLTHNALNDLTQNLNGRIEQIKEICGTALGKMINKDVAMTQSDNLEKIKYTLIKDISLAIIAHNPASAQVKILLIPIIVFILKSHRPNLAKDLVHRDYQKKFTEEIRTLLKEPLKNLHQKIQEEIIKTVLYFCQIKEKKSSCYANHFQPTPKQSQEFLSPSSSNNMALDP